MSKRKANYTKDDILLLLDEIEKTPELVRCDSNMTVGECKMLWEIIACVISCTSQIPRNADEIKAKFADLKSRTKQKCLALNKYSKETGGAPPKDPSDVEKTVVKLTGENSNLGLNKFTDTSASINQVQNDLGLCTREIFEIEILPITLDETVPSPFNEISPIPQPFERQSKPRKRKKSETDEYDIQYLEIAKQQLKTAKDRLTEHQRTNNLLQDLLSVIKDK